jgi:hypothetical protein
MTDYLPEVYQNFERRFPAVKEAFDALGAAEHAAGPLGERERRLIKLGIAVGAESEGGVRSHVRKLLGIDASEAEKSFRRRASSRAVKRCWKGSTEESREPGRHSRAS